MRYLEYNRFLLLSVVGILTLITACSSSDTSIQNVPRQVLLSSSEGLMVNGKQIMLTAIFSNNSSAGASEEDQSSTVRVEITARDGSDLPTGLKTDAVWVMIDDEIWGLSYTGEQLKDDKTRIVKIARNGPAFEEGKRTDVIVRIHHDGRTYLLKAPRRNISKSE